MNSWFALLWIVIHIWIRENNLELWKDLNKKVKLLIVAYFQAAFGNSRSPVFNLFAYLHTVSKQTLLWKQLDIWIMPEE